MDLELRMASELQSLTWNHHRKLPQGTQATLVFLRTLELLLDIELFKTSMAPRLLI